MLFAAFFPFTGGLGEASAVPQGRTGSPRGGVLGRARISFQYARSLRPCLAPPIAPLRRATFRQTLLRAHSTGVARAGAQPREPSGQILLDCVISRVGVQ